MPSDSHCQEHGHGCEDYWCGHGPDMNGRFLTQSTGGATMTTRLDQEDRMAKRSKKSMHLTDLELDTLREYARRRGPEWSSWLRADWSRGGSPIMDHDDFVHIYRLRNRRNVTSLSLANALADG